MLINQREAIKLDAEELHLQILRSVESGEYNYFIDALTDYVKENDIDLSEINKYISPALKNVLYVECCNRGIIKEPNLGCVNDFFT